MNIIEKIEELKQKYTYTECFDYRDSRDISDIIFEIADENVDIYYGKLDKYLIENIDKVEDVINEHGWNGDLYAAVKMAEFMDNEREIHDELDNIILYCALEKLRDDGINELTSDQMDKLEMACSNPDTNKYLDVVVDEAIADACIKINIED